MPVYTLAAIVYFAFSLADLYGVALAALGMLSTLATGFNDRWLRPRDRQRGRHRGDGPAAGGLPREDGLPRRVRSRRPPFLRIEP